MAPSSTNHQEVILHRLDRIDGKLENLQDANALIHNRLALIEGKLTYSKGIITGVAIVVSLFWTLILAVISFIKQ